MADNFVTDAGTGGNTYRSDDVAGVHYPIVKLADGTADSSALIAGDAVNGLDVDVTRVIPGTAATALGKAEDDTHSSGDVGVMALSVRRDAAATGAGADGDYASLATDGSGRLWVNASGAAVPVTDNAGSLTVDNAQLSVVGSGTEATALRVTIASDSTGVLSIDDNGSTVSVDDGAGSLTVDNAALAVVGGGVEASALRVTVASDSTGVLSVDDNGGSLTIDNAQLSVVGSGTEAAAMRVTIATDSTGVLSVDDNGGALTVDNGGTFVVQVNGDALTALQLIDNPVLVDDAGFTPATSSVMMAGFQADEASTDSVNEGDAGAARMTLDRKLIVTLQPHTAGGLTIFRSLDIDESEEEVKATAGVLYSIAAFNRTAAPLYLKFYNATAANVTVGTTTPVLTFVVPANADSDGAGFILEKTYGWTFDTAISVACTTGVADNDTGAPGANDCVINLGYL